LLLRRETRSGLVNRWSLVALGVAVLVVLPYALWFIQHSVSIGEVVQQRLVRTNESHLLRAAMGLRSLFANMPAFLAPWFLVIAGLWWMGRRMDTPTKAGGAAEGVLRDTMLIALAITLTGIVAVGVKHFTVPYLNFLMMPIFPLAAAVLARSGPRDGAELLAAIAVIAMVILTCARIYVLGVGGTSANRSFGPHFPYPALAGALTQRGLAEGTIVAFSARNAAHDAVDADPRRSGRSDLYRRRSCCYFAGACRRLTTLSWTTSGLKWNSCGSAGSTVTRTQCESGQPNVSTRVKFSNERFVLRL
jgi:hypothetical protein